jgi:hypothetical protein
MMDDATWRQLVRLSQRETGNRDRDWWAHILERGPANGDMLMGFPIVVTEAVTGLTLVTPVRPPSIPLPESNSYGIPQASPAGMRHADSVDRVIDGFRSDDGIPEYVNTAVEEIAANQIEAINEEFGWENEPTAQIVNWEEIENDE